MKILEVGSWYNVGMSEDEPSKVRSICCDQCGREIRSGEESLSTTTEAQGAPIGTRAYMGPDDTRTIPTVLCPTCAARRDSTQWSFLWAFLLLVGGMIVAATLIEILPR